MGEFSYICQGCNKPVNAGEAWIIFFLKHGVPVEAHKGHNNNYGGCEEEDDFTKHSCSGEQWQHDEWTKLVDFHFDTDPTSGFAVFHQVCFKGELPTHRSKDDPHQGWGDKRQLYSREKDFTKFGLCNYCLIKINKGHKFCSDTCAHLAMAEEV